MATVTLETYIDRSPSEVWEVLGVRFEEILGWTGIPGSCRLEGEGPVGVGTTRSIKAGPILLRETIAIFEADRRLAYDVHGLPLVRSSRSDWTLRPEGSGTRVRFQQELNLRGGPLGRLVARLIAPANRRLLAGLPKGLKRHLESR